ncbi:MAG: hypothetical protein KDM81_06915 [Verrucomicrobiae bacterium]|nr:hypothetical protein [Verrucomicrobiae bacterium]
MKFVPYWHLAKHRVNAPFWHGGPGSVRCWGWSETSAAEAEARARERVARVAQRMEAGEELPHGYGYPDRPMREPVLREFRDDQGELTAALTRNGYGCVVLNTARLMFVDIDLEENLTASIGRWFKSLFGERKAPSKRVSLEERLQAIATWTQSRPGWGWRVYQTRAGLRLLASHAWFDPKSNDTQTVFEELGADPLYARLCRNQECFRARLTPKPWRCGWHACRVRWPFRDPRAQGAYAKWEQSYLRKAAQRATCRFLHTLGNETVLGEAADLIQLHDETTRAESGLPLA